MPNVYFSEIFTIAAAYQSGFFLYVSGNKSNILYRCLTHTVKRNKSKGLLTFIDSNYRMSCLTIKEAG